MMNPKIKEAKLKKFAESVMNYPRYKEEIKYVLSKLDLTKEGVIQEYINYDMDVYSYGNEVYEPVTMRVVLYLHNLLKGSWHQDRQNVILNMLRIENPKNIIDMGFGVPTFYVKEYILKNRNRHLILLDLYESAFEFSRVLLGYLDDAWREKISFKKLNMNSHEYPGNFDCYIFQDSIEHVENSEAYLSKIVDKSQKKSKFILSLPVGPKVPAHTIGWDTEDKAKKWLNKCGLKIKKVKKVFINPKVDLFADQLKKEFYNLIVLCDKNIQQQF